jgi:hypothetical protein
LFLLKQYVCTSELNEEKPKKAETQKEHIKKENPKKQYEAKK